MSGGMHTPWGIAQTKEQLDEGVFWVKTAEHGGILIEREKAKAILSDRAIRIGEYWNDFLAFEEEHAMMVVFFEHPELYPWVGDTLAEKLAEDRMREQYPEYFTA